TLWLKTCLKLIPFFIAYFLLGTVFNIDFELQLLTSAKIIIFLLLSVYIISTTSLENFLADISFLCKQNSEFTIYLAAIFEFIPLFIKNFKKIRSNPIHAAVNAISKTADESVGIHQNIKKKLEKTLPKRELANIPNMFLLILILLMILRMGKVI
ncbi:MAG: hypothetical protein SVM86_03910, partial [Candidatus Cloacimonadota bacterium]|nr:hypothetical protein [Candidatus Cloacimonadota bacterium]